MVLGLSIHVFRLVGVVLEGWEGSYGVSAGGEEIDSGSFSVAK